MGDVGEQVGEGRKGKVCLYLSHVWYHDKLGSVLSAMLSWP
jgi:hypothetical protein